MKYSYLFIFLAPLINFILFAAVLFKAGIFYFSVIVSCVLIFMAVKSMIGKKIFSIDFLQFSLLPILLNISFATFLLVIISRPLAIMLVIVYPFLLFYYLKKIHERNNNESLENFFSLSGFLIIFALFSSLYGLKAFLSTPTWILNLIMVIGIFAVVQGIFWVNKISFSKALPYLLIISLVMAELTWVSYRLPFNYNLLGLLLAVCYYILIGVTKPILRNGLAVKTVKFYLIFGFLIIFLLLLSAKWI